MKHKKIKILKEKDDKFLSKKVIHTKKIRVNLNSKWYEDIAEVEITPYKFYIKYLDGTSCTRNFGISEKKYEGEITKAGMTFYKTETDHHFTFVNDDGRISGHLVIPNENEKLIEKIKEYIETEF